MKFLFLLVFLTAGCVTHIKPYQKEYLTSDLLQDQSSEFSGFVCSQFEKLSAGSSVSSGNCPTCGG